MEARIGRFRSRTGWVFATLYLVAVAVAYEDYRRHATQWLADIFIFLLTFPATLLGWVLTGGSNRYEVRAADPYVLVPAIIFCACLAYFCGWALGRLAKALRARLR